MPKYVVVDWGSWGIEAQSSSKIIIADPFDVREGNECSLQGKDPATKRPMLFHGHVLAVFRKLIHLLFFSLHRFRTVVQQSFGKPASFGVLALIIYCKKPLHTLTPMIVTL